MLLAVLRETFPGERRVALIPSTVASLVKSGLHVIVERGAGDAAGFLDTKYVEAGAQIAANRNDAFAADCLVQVRTLGANPDAGKADLPLFRPGQILIGLADPLSNPNAAEDLAKRDVTLLALETMPRITRAQSMDVLSSQATIAGYRAVLLAATTLPKMFPLLNHRRGHAHAGQSACARRRCGRLADNRHCARLGAVVSAYDVRAAVKEQIQSLGAKFIELEIDAQAAEGQGGYAKQMDDEFYRRQRELLGKVIAENDVVISTAAIPGKKAPLLITADAVRAMQPASVIVDLAAQSGGNCELTKPGETTVVNGVSILGPTNLPSEVPQHASQMFSQKRGHVHHASDP